MEQLRRQTPFTLPIRFLQFGEGNFLRAFVDWQIDLLNERCGLDAGVVIVRPIPRPGFPLLDTQGGVYTTLVRGLLENGEPVATSRRITCVAREVDPGTAYGDFLALARLPEVRFIVSNTTEAGIAVNATDGYGDAPPSTFPAKLTRLLHERFLHFGGAADKGVVVLPCELIERNGEALKAAVRHCATLWALDGAFLAWLDAACTFCSTLVDRIVTGYPRDESAALEAELGYRDAFLVAAEHFHLFLIQGPAWLGEELRLRGSGLNIQLVEDLAPYRQRKVGVLNGAHTVLVPVALLAGLQTVGGALDDPDVGPFLAAALDREIIPALPLPREELETYAAEVLRRFRNPFLSHRLEAIALNSWSKFAARVMPQLLQAWTATGVPPPRLVLALAATLRLYRGGVIPLADEPAHLDWLARAWARVDRGELSLVDLAAAWLGRSEVWGRDLGPGLAPAVARALEAIGARGIRPALRNLR